MLRPLGRRRPQEVAILRPLSTLGVIDQVSESARRAVVIADREARRYWHPRIGIEHLLLGLVDDPDCVAARALGEIEISPDQVRALVAEVIGTEPSTGTGSTYEVFVKDLLFTPRAERVLQDSLREALQIGHDRIGTGHVLLSLCQDRGGALIEQLYALDVRPERLMVPVLRLHEQGRPG